MSNLPAVRDVQIQAIPDANLNEPGRPVPEVVEALLPLGHLRCVADLAEPAGRSIEYDLQGVVFLTQMAGEVVLVWHKATLEPAHLVAVDQEPARIIETKGAEVDALVGSQPSVGYVRRIDPVAVLHPLAQSSIEPDVPVR